MKDFFHGWRRKAGVVTLGLACAVMGMWVRSLRSFDAAYFMMEGRQHAVYSVNASLNWSAWKHERDMELNKLASQAMPAYDWWIVAAMPGGEYDYNEHGRWSIPNLSIVLPLTLLSAYLLLWKPRTRS